MNVFFSYPAYDACRFSTDSGGVGVCQASSNRWSLVNSCFQRSCRATAENISKTTDTKTKYATLF